MMFNELLTNLLSVFKDVRVDNTISKDTILWNNKEIKDKSVLLWDLENIPFSRLEEIKKIAKYTPDELYVVTTQALGETLREKITSEHFKILDDHKTISDTKIISIMRLYKDRENMILISSDSDFAKEVNNYIKKHRLQWIVTNYNKKAVIMRVNLASTNLSISTLNRVTQKNKQATSKKYHKNRKQKNKYANTYKIDNAYNLSNTIDYYKHRVKRKLNKIYKKLKFILLPKSYRINTAISKQNNLLPNNPIPGKRDIYRRDYKNKRHRCGKLQFNEDGEIILMLYKNLLTKYEIPNFSKLIRFNEFTKVDHLIHFNQKEKEYYLNEFTRR